MHEHASTTAIARSRIRHLYALLEFKIALFARSESSLHGLRVLFSVLESLRLLLVEYLWDPVAGTPPLRRNGLVWLVVGVAKVVSLPRRLRPPDR